MPGKKPRVDTDAIARKAYELWAARGYPHGDPEHDWHEAERHLMGEAGGKKAKRSSVKKGARKSS